MESEIVRRALQACSIYCSKRRAEGSVIVGKLMEGKDDNVGYDAKVNEFTDMIKAGVIDPTKWCGGFAKRSVRCWSSGYNRSYGC